MIQEIARAKINLFLHVGPVRRDGLHWVESLFAFADDGDCVAAAPADALTLAVVGPFAEKLAGFPSNDNLVLRAAHALKSAAGVRGGAALTLDKRLPVASGVGGGSADAAAALRALIRLWRIDIDGAALRRLAFSLGADIPACLDGAPVLVSGAGEVLAPGPKLPPLWAALVNPGAPMPTGPVFQAFDRARPDPERPMRPASCGATYAGLGRLLSQSRNDLEPFAVELAEGIGEVRRFLAECCGNLAARMSGSGATVFGLFASRGAAERAARKARGRGWWSMAAAIGAGSGAAGEQGVT